MNPRVENVKCPEPNPDETKRMFHEMGKRREWGIYGDGKNDNIMPPTNPPRPTGEGGGDDDDRPNPLPVAEIGIEQYQELAPAPHRCWNCNAEEKVTKLPNGAYLCPRCIDIMKP